MGTTNSNEKEWLKWRHRRRKIKTKRLGKPKDIQKKGRVYKVVMLLKYWKATTKEPIRDLCMVIAMYVQDTEPGLLYAVGGMTTLTTNIYGFKSIDTLSRIKLKNKDGEEVLVKGVMNGSGIFHAFLFEDMTVRVIENNKSTFDIKLKSEIITMNSGNYCDSLFVIDAKMHGYEIKDKTAIRVTGLPDGIKIKDISCGSRFTVFLSEYGRVFGMGWNDSGRLGLPRRIETTKIPIEIIFPNQSNLDKNKIIIIKMIHAGWVGWVAVDSKQRAWIVGEFLMQSVQSDYKFLDPCISIVEIWHFNEIRITQIGCGWKHVIALDTEGRVYLFGKFNYDMPLSDVSSDPISFPHRIKSIRSSADSVACKDVTNEWYVWGCNSYNHITGSCRCGTICKKTKSGNVILNPMKCEWQGLFDSSRVINLQLGCCKAHIIVDPF